MRCETCEVLDADPRLQRKLAERILSNDRALVATIRQLDACFYDAGTRDH